MNTDTEGVSKVFHQWWPLATSWFFLTFEPLMIAALVARTPDPTVQLAAWGGLIFPITVLLEAPTYMLLSASATLTCDQESYRAGLRHAVRVALFCAVLQVIVVLPPIYRWLMESLLSPPVGVAEAAYPGFVLLSLSALCVAVRRFHQGILVRLGRSRTVGIGTALRIACDLALFSALTWADWFSSATTAACSYSMAMVLEAIYALVVSRSAVASLPANAELLGAKKILKWREFVEFYAPLASTSVLLCLTQPLGAAAMGRARLPLESLAVWPAVITMIASIRSLNTAIPELFVSRATQGLSVAALRKLAIGLGVAQTVVVATIALSGIGRWWFLNVAGLSDTLTGWAVITLRCGILLPMFSTLQSWQQGRLLTARSSATISMAVVCSLFVVGILMALGIALTDAMGAALFMAVMTFGMAVQFGYNKRAADRLTAPPLHS